jgi:type II secretory pathway pseudopilin PulG
MEESDMRIERSNFSARTGFSRIDLIAVVAVITLLVAVLVPVLQHQREQARKQQCKNHLKQLGLALHNYHDTFITTFPPGYIYHVQAAVLESHDTKPQRQRGVQTPLLVDATGWCRLGLECVTFCREGYSCLIPISL